jgi:hypothetical protein
VKCQQTMIARWLVRMACAIALLFVGFGHQAPASAASTFAQGEFAEYVLPDGTLPVICIADKDSRVQPHGKKHQSECEACLVSGAVILPTPGSFGIVNLRIEDALASPHVDAIARKHAQPPNKGARAPPLLHITA